MNDVNKIKKLEKLIGFDLKSAEDIKNETKITTGYLGLDYLMNGGFKEGSFITFYGATSSCKTTIALKMIAHLQKEHNMTALIVDVENGFDYKRLESLGVDTDPSKLTIFDTPITGLKLYEVISQICTDFDIVLIDSITAMMPEIDDEKDLDEGTIRSVEATMHSRGLRKINNKRIKDNKKCNIILLGHEKENPQARVKSTYMPGGKAPGFYSNYIINIRKKYNFDRNWNKIGVDINKVRDEDIAGVELLLIGDKVRNSPPKRNVTMHVSLEDGSTRLTIELFELAKRTGIIERNGNTYSVMGTKIKIAGYDKFIATMDTDKELYTLLHDLVREYMLTHG